MSFPLPRHLICAALAALASTSAHAQDAGALLKQQERQQQQGLPEHLPSLEAEQARPALRAETGVRVLVRTVRFTGAVDLVPEAELQALVADAVGRELDFAGLEALAQRVTDHLKARGWFLARAYLPRQDLTDGTLEIALLAGRLDGRSGKGVAHEIVASGERPLRIAPERLDALAAARLAPGAVAREADIERAALLIGDLPGLTAKARLEPGTDPDSTRIVLDVEEGPLLTGSLSLDNAGNRGTGVPQANALLQLNDPLRRGDQWVAGVTLAEGMTLGRLVATLPVGAHGTKLSANASHLDYEYIRGAGKTAGLEGTATTWGLAASHPVVRSRIANVYVSAAYTGKTLEDNSSAGNVNDKAVDVGTVNVSGDRFDRLGGGGLSFGTLAYTFGDLDLSGNPTAAANDAAAYRTAGGFHKWTATLGRLQKLPGAFTLFAQLGGQKAGGNLDSSEQFILGGPYGVRAYPVSEASGDTGWLANLEVRYDVRGAGTLGKWQLIGFYDTGRIVLHDDARGLAISTATGRNDYGLSGWGVGVHLVKTGSHALRLTWARKIGDNPGRTTAGLDADGRDNTSRVWISGTLFF